MKMLIMPVANGILPRPNGGRITGMFIVENGGQLLADVGVGKNILVCPWSVDEYALYSVGVICRILNIWSQEIVDEAGNPMNVIMAVLEGQEHARWYSVETYGTYLLSSDIEYMNFKKMRKEYPVISCAGWMPAGGYTEFRDKNDIPVTIYGTNLENGHEVAMTGNLGGLVTQEKAHTLEHAIIRALRTYGLCSAKTLIQSMAQESQELKQSVEYSIRYQMPELLGMTDSGVCGNPMTNLAQFYLAKDFVDNIKAGKSYNDAVVDARRKTMSQLSQDLNLTMQEGLRVLQGLKKGMKHDDTPLNSDICMKIIKRFPFDPWT